MLEKLDRPATADAAARWIDPQGYLATISERQQAFATELARQSR